MSNQDRKIFGNPINGVMDFEMGPANFGLLSAIDDMHIRRSIEWQYEHQPPEDALRRQYHHLIDYITTSYPEVPTHLGQIIFNYHHSRLSGAPVFYE